MTEPSQSNKSTPADINATVRRGTRWVLLAQVASQLVSLAVLAWMLRLVSPADYGLLGMILPAVMLPRMAATLGLATVVMQRHLSHGELSSLFWLNVLWGLVAAAATALGGPLLARAYDQPVLAPLGLALAGSTLIVALGNQHAALLERKFRLGPLAGIRLLAQVCGGVAGIYAGRREAGIWALAAQQYAEISVLTIWVWLAEPWRPCWPVRSDSVGKLALFSGYYSASQLAYFIAQNLDKVLLPVLLGPVADRAVGFYSQAFNLMMKPVYLLTSPLTGVMVAGLSQTNDSPAIRTELAVRFFRLVGIVLFPCAAGLTVVAPDLMLVLGGVNWRDSGRILVILAPALLVQGLVNIGGHVLAAAGKSGRLLGATIALCGLLILSSWLGVAWGRVWLLPLAGDSAVAAALGMGAAYCVVLLGFWGPLFLLFSLRSARLPPWPIIKRLWPSLFSSLAMGIAVLGMQFLPAVQSLPCAIRLTASVALGMGTYFLLARREIAWLFAELFARERN